jgi:hypothetical protein
MHSNLHHQINRLEFVNLPDTKGLHGLPFVQWIPTAQNPAVDFSLRSICIFKLCTVGGFLSTTAIYMEKSRWDSLCAACKTVLKTLCMRSQERIT